MKKIFIFYGLLLILLTSLIVYQGCAKFDNTITSAPDIDTHPDGWANPSSSTFHGKYIVSKKLWNLNQCKACHAADYTGGSTGSSCLGCHNGSGGPENCRLCHGNSDHANPPKGVFGDTLTSYIGVGVHATHVNNPKYSAALHCSDCHAFGGFSDPNHIGDNPDGIAEITFGDLAKDTSLGGGIKPNPIWNRTNATCSSVYCHGTFKQGNTSASATWTDANSVKCGSCHGNPSTGNPTPQVVGVFTSPHFSFMTTTTCYICHGSVINGQGVFVDKSKHINGEVNY
ncbi:MAG: CxxxxCH/CxxCH domain-containing protein [Bacteroidetes bacterium]|nr:CxxxxCH/CxxCH domain-containing protein [Bacteroidota bacterium]